jgi:uroporphyrinogen decarboxylase
MIAADHLARLIKQPLDRVCKHGGLLAEGLLTAEEMYNPDFLIVFSDIAVEAEALGVGLEFSQDRNPHIVRQLDPNQVGLIDMPACGRLPELFRAAEICRKALDPRFPVFFSMKDPFSLAALVMGSEAFLMALLNAPEVVNRLLDVCCRNQLRLVEAICGRGYIPLVGAPIASGSLIGPRWFREFAQPCLETLYNRIRELGSFCCLHICGEVAPIKEQLPRLNLDLLSFEEWCAPMWDKMPDTIPMGYVPTDLFARGSEDTVRSATLDSLVNLPRPCVLSTACDLPANADPRLVKTFGSQ